MKKILVEQMLFAQFQIKERAARVQTTWFQVQQQKLVASDLQQFLAQKTEIVQKVQHASMIFADLFAQTMLDV